MGNFDNKKSKKKNNRTGIILVLGLIAITLAVILALMVLPLMKDNTSFDESTVTVSTVQTQETEEVSNTNIPTDSKETAPMEGPTESETPGNTEEATETESSVNTEVPAETEAPANTEAPAETEVPADTEVPAETEAPANTEAPAETEAPANTEAPTESEEPTNTEKPTESDDPENTEDPTYSDVTEQTEDPTYSDNSVNPEVSDQTEDPTYSNDAVATSATESPVEPEKTEPKETVGTNISEVVSFPALLADGKLKIENFFQFDGLNPDCNNQGGTNIGSITVTNISEEYLVKADISITTDEGNVLRFVIQDLPSGKSAAVFAVDNATSKADGQYGDIVCDAVFDPTASMMEDKIAVSVDGIQVVLKNKTDKKIDKIVVYCRSTMGEQYFGGITYSYTVNSLPANGTAEVMAVDCILGLAEVVRIVIN